MGQRLVLNLERNAQVGEAKEFASLYYHWSAYTTSALEQIMMVWIHWNGHKEYDYRLRAIRIAEEQGGGIRNGAGGQEWVFVNDNIQTDKPFKSEGISRNEGLVAISKEGMDDLNGWAESTAWLNVDTGMVDFGTFFQYDSIEEYNKLLTEDGGDKVSLQDIPLVDIPDMGIFHADSIQDMLDKLSVISTHEFRDVNGNIIEMIE